MYYCPLLLPLNFGNQQVQLESNPAYYPIYSNSNLPQFYNQTYIISVNNLLASVNQLEISQNLSLPASESKQSTKIVAPSQKKVLKLKQKISSSQEYNPNGGSSTTVAQISDSKNYQYIKNQEFSDNMDVQNQDDLSEEINLNENFANYPKKNTESNIVNQIFSFVSSENKSKFIVERHFEGNNKKIVSFYQVLKAIKKRKKKYINRKYLGSLCTMKENDVGYKMLLRARNKMNVLEVRQFQKLLALLIMYYLNKETQVNIITSKKINRVTYTQHLERRREIRNYLMSKFKESGALNAASQQK